MASRALATNTAIPPSRFTRTNRYPSPPPPQATSEEVSPVSPVSPSASPILAPARPSFSAFDEIHLETPRELQPLGLGLTGTARPTSEAFRENFNRFNNIPRGGGLGSLGNLRRSDSSSSTSSRGSARSGRSSVSDSGDLPEKPPVYVSAEEVKEEKVNEPRKKVAWWHMSKWTPLMWIQVLFFLGLPTFTLTWTISLTYFTLLPRLFPSRKKSLDDWVLEGVERSNTTAAQEGIAIDGTECMDTKRRMRRWEIATAAAAGLIWTILCVAFGIIAVEATRKGIKSLDYGNGDVVGAF